MDRTLITPAGMMTSTTSRTSTSGDADADLHLVERYLSGDLTAFDEIMVRYERQIFRLCYRFTSNSDDARDLAQDVFVKAFENLVSFRRESSLKTWLYRIATNHCINHVKSNTRQFVEVTDSVKQTNATAHGMLEEKEQREYFRGLVRQLPPKQRAILELRIHEQLSYEEIANMSNRSISTIKASVFFALEKLRKLVKEPLKVRG
jgi:RNA polymerase sigma-70 factor (ECF subfamily)